MSEALIKAVVATAQVMGTDLSEDAARMFCSDLGDYNESAVMQALTRCRREVKGKLTLADVISRIDDGRPGANEAWSMLPKSEAETAVWTDEMCAASIASSALSDDPVAARMAFIEAYNREVTKARAEKKPVYWWPTLGFDAAGREPVIRQAVELGRITVQQALKALPNCSFDEAQPARLGGEWHIAKLLAKEPV